jgi:hypothetical protein
MQHAFECQLEGIKKIQGFGLVHSLLGKVENNHLIHGVMR